MQAGSGKWRKRSPQTPPPPRSLGTPRCPLNTAPLRGPQAGLWKSPAHPLPGKFSGVTRAPLRLHLPSSAQGRRERGQRAGGATSRDLPVAERRPTGSSPGHPRGAQTGGGRGAEGDSDGRPGFGVPTGPVKCSTRPLPAPITRDKRGIIRCRTPGPRPLRGPDPTRDPASGPPTTASAPEEARRALLTPLDARRRLRAPREPRAPSLPLRPPRPASRGRTCARRRRRRRRSPAPLGCAGAAPNPTHIATHSPLTSPSPRPAHVTAETHGFPQTPPPSPAARGRARAAVGGGEERRTEPAAAPRAQARRCRLAAPSPSGTRAPSAL